MIYMSKFTLPRGRFGDYEGASITEKITDDPLCYIHRKSTLERLTLIAAIQWAGGISYEKVYAACFFRALYIDRGIFCFIQQDRRRGAATAGTLSEKYSLAKNTDTAFIDIEGEYLYDEAYEILALVNAERLRVGAIPLQMDAGLLDAGMLRAVECAVFYGHTRPDGTRWTTALPPNMAYAGENAAIGQTSALDVMNSWANSPGHYSNIVNPNYRAIGIGAFREAYSGHIHWIQVFSNRLGNPQTASPPNRQEVISINTLWAQILLNRPEAPINIEIGDSKNALPTITANNPMWTYSQYEIKASTFIISSDNTTVATVLPSGIVHGASSGNANIVVRYRNGIHAFSLPVRVSPIDISRAEVSLKTTQYAYSGQERKPSVSVLLDGKKLKESMDYIVQCSENIEPGLATVRIIGQGNYTGSLMTNFMILPKKVSLSSVVSGKKGELLIAWARNIHAEEYQLQYALDSEFTKGRKTTNITQSSATSHGFTNVPSKKTYYVRLRAGININGKVEYGAWSDTLHTKIQ